MSMTPEERAKALYQFLFDHDAIDTGTLIDVESVIVRAIKDAKNAVLGKAAREVERRVGSADPYEYGIAYNAAVRQCVDVIEALKSKD